MLKQISTGDLSLEIRGLAQTLTKTWFTSWQAWPNTIFNHKVYLLKTNAEYDPFDVILSWMT